MAFVAALSAGNLRCRVSEYPECRSHMVVPQMLLHLQASLGALQNLIVYSVVMGCQPCPLLNEWVKYMYDEAVQLSGAFLVGHGAFIDTSRVTQNDKDNFQIQKLDFISESTRWFREITEWMTALLDNHFEEVQRMVSTASTFLDMVMDDLMEDDVCAWLLRQLHDVLPTAKALKDAALPLQRDH